MVTGGSVNRVGIGWPGSGERWATAPGWYHVDWFGLIRGLVVAGKNVLRSGWEEQRIQVGVLGAELKMVIASAKSRSVRGASHQPAFMSGCLTISHTCLPCLPSARVSPSVLGVI